MSLFQRKMGDSKYYGRSWTVNQVFTSFKVFITFVWCVCVCICGIHTLWYTCGFIGLLVGASSLFPLHGAVGLKLRSLEGLAPNALSYPLSYLTSTVFFFLQ